jgi:hypothetical protein
MVKITPQGRAVRAAAKQTQTRRVALSRSGSSTLPRSPQLLNRSFCPSRKFGKHPRARNKSGHAEKRVPLPCPSATAAVPGQYQRKAHAEKEPPDDVRADARRLDVQVHLGEVVQREYADHADDNCGEHYLHDGPVLKKQLADEHVVFANAPFLQEEAKHQAKNRTRNQLGSRGYEWCAVCRGRFSVLTMSIIVPHSLKSSRATATPPTKKQITAIHDATLS